MVFFAVTNRDDHARLDRERAVPAGGRSKRLKLGPDPRQVSGDDLLHLNWAVRFRVST
jgi:hypothetical protein